MIMKKIFAVILALCIMLACVGCGGDEAANPEQGKQPSITEQPEDSKTPTEDEKPDGGQTVPPTEDEKEITAMYIYINGNRLEVTLAANAAVDELVKRLKQGDITYTASDYGNFEKVGSLGFGLPASNTQITTQPGDVILYSGNQIVLFYGSNSWSYTRLGKINGYSAAQLRTLLGAGNGSSQVTISLK